MATNERTARNLEAEGKRTAGVFAANQVETDMVLGLGTGSTVQFALERLAARIRDHGLRIRGVPTSSMTATEAKRLAIPLTTLEDDPELDLTIDGADEVDPARCLIKGGGAALTREKIVAAASQRMLVIVGRNKLVDRLGIDFLLPVEVLTFGFEATRRKIAELGCETYLRQDASGATLVTDNGNWIVDCRFENGIADPVGLEPRIDAIPGVVECGLFCGLASSIVVGEPDGGVTVL
ncbi:MAG: ribose 5-phosphate isomerase A [Planctomycetes bacterium]|nr:ribose 5-phosphate isomerase A [Planctomycetota bacterium]